MPGMNSGLNPSDPTIVNAFRSAESVNLNGAPLSGFY